MTNYVRDEDQLAEEVKGDKVVTLATSAEDATGAREQVLDTDRTSGTEVLLTC